MSNKKEVDRAYRERNKEKVLAYNRVNGKKWRDANKEKIRENRCKYRLKKVIKPRVKKEPKSVIENAMTKKAYYEANKERLKKKQKEWREANKEKIRAYSITKYGTDVLYKLKTNVKNLIGNSIRNANFKKLSKTEQVLGCSYLEFKKHLESSFEYWMNWDNRGLYNGCEYYGWDIDHKIPLSSAKDELDILRLNHYTNLQPLCSYQNRIVKRGCL